MTMSIRKTGTKQKHKTNRKFQASNNKYQTISKFQTPIIQTSFDVLGELFMKSTIKVFQVLETLCEGKAAGVSELSNQLGIKPSSMHRFLAVLTKLGYVQKNANSGKYFATLKIFQLGVSVRNKLSLISIARPYMEELGEMLKEAVNIAVFAQNSVVVIDRVQSPATLPTNIIVGQHLPAYCTAFGKILLAAMSAKELARYLKTVTLKPLTAQTITQAPALREELKKISKNGYAIDNRELDENIRCLSGPIRDESGKVVAALSFSGPTTRVNMVRLKTYIKTMTDISEEISQKLGYRKKKSP
jgi:DNA-binding IclR family transcriptional regulator